MKQKRWGPEQDGILLRHYGKMPVAELIGKYLPGWSESPVIHHASALGLTQKQAAPSRWTQDEDDVLRHWYGRITMKEIKTEYLPHRTIGSIKKRVSVLGLKSYGLRKPWTEAEDETIRKYYAAIPIQDLAARLPGRTTMDINSHARFLGLELGRHNNVAWREYRRLTDGGTHGTNFAILQKKDPNKNSSTGVRGVSLDRRSGKYRATVTFQRRLYNLGYYATLEEAAKARAEGMEKLRPVLATIKADIAGRKDELVAQAVQIAAEIRQADEESHGDAPPSAGTAP